MTDVAAGATVARHELRAGPLLAEGGEGRVYELVGRPGFLYKAYRRHPPAGPLLSLIAWREALAGSRPELARRIDAATAWPSAVVTEPGAAPGTAAGLLLPRAPRRFSVRHRDGHSRLATLSYLTTDPGQRAAAYGLALPAPFSTERIGIVYALARVLEAFQVACPSIGHGDLSAKNVLWSLERGPEVFLLDCDSCERYGPDGAPLDAEHRRRAMTPNWDDPAIPAGANPTASSDRYSLALIFLRVVGAAHFPLQSRQRQGEVLAVDFSVPTLGRRARSLAPHAAIWDVCARSLSANRPDERPPAAAWVGALEQVLDDLGAMALVRATWSAQGGGAPGSSPAPVTPDPGRDVLVRPVAAGPTARWERRRPAPGPAGAGPWRGRGSTQEAPPVPARPADPAAAAPQDATAESLRQLKAEGRRAARSWLALHRSALSGLARSGRRTAGAVRLLACLALDFVVLVAVGFAVAMVVSPWLGI